MAAAAGGCAGTVDVAEAVAILRAALQGAQSGAGRSQAIDQLRAIRQRAHLGADGRLAEELVRADREPIRLSRSLVVDASVALKWVVTEPGSEEAASLLDEMAVGAVALLAPERRAVVPVPPGCPRMGDHGLRRSIRA